jgi:RNA polymerase primary sigma factor
MDGPDPVEAGVSDDGTRGIRARVAGRLDAREREVVALRFGLEGGVPLPLSEAARRLGMTWEFVRKFEIRALSKLTAETTRTGISPLPIN